MGYRLHGQTPSRAGEPDDPASPEAQRRSSAPTRRRRAALKTIAVLPTMFTLGNLLCGFLAVFLASRSADVARELPFGWSPLTFAASFIFLGMVLDGLDGRIARMARATSDLGEQLDSMADMVTFGVAPAFLTVQLVNIKTPFFSQSGDQLFNRAALVIACIYVACAGLRLARFNVETASPEVEDHMSFKGLPSPGAAGTVASLVLLHQHYFHTFNIRLGSQPDLAVPLNVRLTALILTGVLGLTAFAMVSRLRYVHVTNRYLSGRAPFHYVALGVAGILLLAIWPQQSLATSFVLYAVSAPAVYLIRRLLRRPPRDGEIPPDQATLEGIAQDDPDETVADERTAG